MKKIQTTILIAAMTTLLGCQSNSSTKEEQSETASNGDVTTEICTCLKKAANTYMVQGEKASEHDLMQLCNQFEGALKGADIDQKRIVKACLDEVKQHIDDKLLFTDVEDVKLPEVPCGSALKDELEKVAHEKVVKGNKIKVMEYYLKNRTLECSIAVKDVMYHPLAMRTLGLFKIKGNPEYYLQDKEGNIYVTGGLYSSSTIEDMAVVLMIPAAEKDKLKLMDEDKNYKQVIKFTATINQFVENGYGLSPVFKPSKYEFMDYNPAH